jgi:hypothetical protein
MTTLPRKCQALVFSVHARTVPSSRRLVLSAVAKKNSDLMLKQQLCCAPFREYSPQVPQPHAYHQVAPQPRDAERRSLRISFGPVVLMPKQTHRRGDSTLQLWRESDM